MKNLGTVGAPTGGAPTNQNRTAGYARRSPADERGRLSEVLTYEPTESSRSQVLFRGLESPPDEYVSLNRKRRIPAVHLFFAVILLMLAAQSYAAPIQRIQGVISEVGEGFLMLEPDDHSGPRRFILRWKARFRPPKLPIKGDRVLILYKDKDQGSVIYGVNYLAHPRGHGKTEETKSAE